MKHLPELQKQPAARDVNTLVRHTTKGPPIFVSCPKQFRSFPRENIPFKEAASKKDDSVMTLFIPKSKVYIYIKPCN